ncbi:MAG: NADH-quinone oxidoreductase subunit K [Gammaproteobacteria bacterium]|jgi:multicomponent Na+:H+ antiporter subunit C|nr:NADH-quinone oxidoreductase subunit K [Gammaproteobacteria bacterium]
MSSALFYALVGVGLLSLGLYALVVHEHLLRKILAINIMGSGVFLLLVALAKHSADAVPDAVPQAMVITGIVVAVSATALALVLMLRLAAATGRARLSDDQDAQH